MAIVVLNGPIIAAGELLSAGLDCTDGDLVRFTMPAAWTPANLTFQLSSDGQFFNDLFDVHGKEVMIAVQPGTAVIFAADRLAAVAHIKFRSGTRDDPVVQTAQRAFAVAIDDKKPTTMMLRSEPQDIQTDIQTAPELARPSRDAE